MPCARGPSGPGFREEPQEPPLSTFTPDVARELGGPAWLQARRTAAAEAFAATPLPTTDEEVWRYSRVADLDLDRFRPVADAGDGPPAATAPVVGAARAWLPDAAAVVVVVDGQVVSVDMSDEALAEGLFAGALGEDSALADVLGSVAADADAFGLLNDAFGLQPILVRVPRGVTLDRPILVVHHASGSGEATFPRVVVQAGENSQATVVEHHTSAAGGIFTAAVTELDVARAARLTYASVQDLAGDAWSIARCVSRVAQDATLVSGAAALGGEYARLRTDCRLDGRGATGTLLAAYFGEADQTLDFRTFQDHRAPDTTSNLLFKGAVADRSRSVYTGLIRVRPEARGTNAFQTNRNIKLGQHAWAESVPNLEIENNDVRCSHASTVGPIDEEQRFYLESRGVPPRQAERLVVAGFFAEVVSQLPAAVVPHVTSGIAAKLDRIGVGATS